MDVQPSADTANGGDNRQRTAHALVGDHSIVHSPPIATRHRKVVPSGLVQLLRLLYPNPRDPIAKKKNEPVHSAGVAAERRGESSTTVAAAVNLHGAGSTYDFGEPLHKRVERNPIRRRKKLFPRFDILTRIRIGTDFYLPLFATLYIFLVVSTRKTEH